MAGKHLKEGIRRKQKPPRIKSRSQKVDMHAIPSKSKHANSLGVPLTKSNKKTKAFSKPEKAKKTKARKMKTTQSRWPAQKDGGPNQSKQQYCSAFLSAPEPRPKPTNH